MNPQQNDEVAEYMRSLGFKEEFPGRFYGVVDGAHRVINKEAAEFFYQAQKAAVAEARLTAMHDLNTLLLNQEYVTELESNTITKIIDQGTLDSALRGKQ